MILKSELNNIVKLQLSVVKEKELGIKRELYDELSEVYSHALIISGIRRCGKSTLFVQLLKEKYPDSFYFNFEHPRLYDFDKNDFNKLDELIKESGKTVLLFDEIQNIPEWERFVRLKLDEGFKIIINGSNASLFSSELGTKLTGRHVTRELFPFSYQEFCTFCSFQKNEESLVKYLKIGGFPDFVIMQDTDYLHQLFDDILVRDIAVRYGVRDLKTLKRMALFLLSNIGRTITGNKLKTILGVGATSTVMEYLSHFEYSYLFFFVPKFSYSVRKQMVNPRKVYSIDTGMATICTGILSESLEYEMENLVFLHLRRNYDEIYYFSDNGECDFIAFGKSNVKEIIQVCAELSQDNLEKEINGLFTALEFFNLTEGVIITQNQNDRFEKNGLIATVIPIYEYI